MKYVREHINEKFRQDSDPIEDMGIGIKNWLDKVEVFCIQEIFGNRSDANLFIEIAYDKLKTLFAKGVSPEKAADLCYDDINIFNEWERQKNEKMGYHGEPEDDLKANCRHYQSEDPTKENVDELTRYLISRHPNRDEDSLWQTAASWIGYEQPLDEKFTQDSDPIKDLNIGVFTKKYFKNAREVVNYLFKVLPAILGTTGIPKDTIQEDAEPNNCYKWDYFWKITNYCNKYMYYKNTGNTVNFQGDVYTGLANKLKKHGYQKKFKNPVTNPPKLEEKFTHDSDPISDLNIGIKAQIQKWLKEEVFSYQFSHSIYYIIKDLQRNSREKNDAILVLCANEGKTDFVKYLIEKGANVNYDNAYALRRACHWGHLDIVKLLINAGVNVNASHGDPIAWASHYNHPEIVKILLDAGANPLENEGWAIKQAIDHNNKKVVELFNNYSDEVKQFIKDYYVYKGK